MKKKYKMLWLIIPLLLCGCDISTTETTSNSLNNSITQPTTSLEPSSSTSTPLTPSSSNESSSSSFENEDWKDLYYNDSSYTLIGNIVESWKQDQLLEGNIKTWGIVSKALTNLEGNQCFYLQSENRNHDYSAIFVDNYVGDIKIQQGNVLSLEGTMAYIDNTLTLLNPYNVHVDYEKSLDSIEPFELSYDYFSSTELENIKKQGHRFISFSQVTFVNSNDQKYYIEVEDKMIFELLIDNTKESSQIRQRFSKFSINAIISLKGFFKFGAQGFDSIQISVADTKDIIGPRLGTFKTTLSEYAGNLTSKKYSTGNYGYFTYEDFTFDYYRSVYESGSSYFIKLLALNYRNSLGGMVSNYDAIPNIVSIEVSYSTETMGNKKPRLYYGENNQLHDYRELPITTTTIKSMIEFDETENIQFFRLESGDTNLILNYVTIQYLNIYSPNEKEYASSGEGLYRNNPSYYQGELEDGASFTLPVEVEKVGDTYRVISEKTYYYYSYSYLENHPEAVELGTYTDPIDVANYFNAFHTYPANYVSKREYSSARSIFGNDTRLWSYYERTDGYARTVPYRNGEKGRPRYYELDIDVDGNYSSSNRGVGRLVVWLDGWDVEGYDENPVTVYTDDHYATFQEYYNNGLFSHRFNAINSSRRSNFTNYYWGEPEILTN